MDETPITYVIRLSGTLSTKAPRTRRRFSRRLEGNLRDALDRRGVEYTLEREWARIFVETRGDGVGELLGRICGVQGVRPSYPFEWSTLEEIVEEGRARFAGRVDGRTFAVRARRVGQREAFDFDSMDVNRRLGTALDEAGGTVDLEEPEVEVRLEVDSERAYFFDREISGPGGLPIGTEGRALALVSGGFDSVVAAWTMLKRGVALDFLFFNLGGPPHERGVRRVIGALGDTWIFGDEPQLHVVDFRPVLADLKTEVPGSYWQVLLKRAMLLAAEHVIDDGPWPAVVTGEAVGQVSSQTLPNLAAIEAAVDVPVLRPLVGYNKEEIVALAREVEVHDAAETVPEFCALDGGNPVTSTSAAKLDRHQRSLDLSLIERLSDDRRIHDLRELAATPDEPDVQIDRVPANAALVDLRSESEFESWHPPEALHIPFETALEQYAMLPTDPSWLLYCDVGLKSALIAEKMQQVGFDAHSFRGGVPKLRKWLEDSPAHSGAARANESE